MRGMRGMRGKRGRGASGKTPAGALGQGLLKRNGRVYTEIVPDCSKASLQAVLRGRVAPEVVIHSDGWRGYDGLVDVGYAKHFRVDHGSNEFVVGTRHINGIESFWSFADPKGAPTAAKVQRCADSYFLFASQRM